MTKPLNNMIIVYHGSPLQNLKEIKADKIFVSPNKAFAACYGARWNDGDAYQLSQNGTIFFCKNSNVKNNKCSLYVITTDKSNILKYNADEYTIKCPKDIKIINEIKYNTFNDMLNDNGVHVISMDEFKNKYLKSIITEGGNSTMINKENVSMEHINFEKYLSIHSEVMNRLNDGAITVEMAKEVTDLAFEKYIEERSDVVAKSSLIFNKNKDTINKDLALETFNKLSELYKIKIEKDKAIKEAPSKEKQAEIDKDFLLKQRKINIRLDEIEKSSPESYKSGKNMYYNRFHRDRLRNR